MERIQKLFIELAELPVWKQKLVWFIVNRKADIYFLQKGGLLG